MIVQLSFSVSSILQYLSVKMLKYFGYSLLNNLNLIIVFKNAIRFPSLFTCFKPFRRKVQNKSLLCYFVIIQLLWYHLSSLWHTEIHVLQSQLKISVSMRLGYSKLWRINLVITSNKGWGNLLRRYLDYMTVEFSIVNRCIPPHKGPVIRKSFHVLGSIWVWTQPMKDDITW